MCLLREQNSEFLNSEAPITPEVRGKLERVKPKMRELFKVMSNSKMTASLFPNFINE